MEKQCSNLHSWGDSVHLEPCVLKLVTATYRSPCNGPSHSAFSKNGIIVTVANT